MALTRIAQDRRAAHRGFSLFEVIVAVALLTVGIVSTLNVLSATSHQKRDSNVESSAAVLAGEKMELLKAGGFADATSEVEDFGSIPDYGAYRRETDVTAGDGGDLKTVTVTVEERLSGERYQLVTLMRR